MPVLILVAATEGFRAARPNNPVLVVLRGVLVTAAALGVVWSFTRLPMTDGYALVFLLAADRDVRSAPGCWARRSAGGAGPRWGRGSPGCW